MSAINLGTQFENLAANYLQQHQLIVLQRNFRCKLGEIDLIAKEKDCLVFAEVRYRKSSAFGSAAESITAAKQQKIIRTAQVYLQHKSWAQNVKCRFDVIAISQSLESPKIEWIKDAFNG